MLGLVQTVHTSRIRRSLWHFHLTVGNLSFRLTVTGLDLCSTCTRTHPLVCLYLQGISAYLLGVTQGICKAAGGSGVGVREAAPCLGSWPHTIQQRAAVTKSGFQILFFIQRDRLAMTLRHLLKLQGSRQHLPVESIG